MKYTTLKPIVKKNFRQMKKIDLGLDFEAIRERISQEKRLYNNKVWAKKTLLSQASLSNIHGKKRTVKPSLEYVIAVATFTGKPIEWYLYGETAQSKSSEETCPYQCDPRLRDLCEKVKNVMESETHWSDSLEANIKSFKKGLDNDRELESIKRRLDHIEKMTSSGLDGGTSQKPADCTVASRKAG